MTRLLLMLLALALFAGCTTVVRTQRTYGAPAMFPDNDGKQTIQGTSSWGATDENYHPASPTPFKPN